MSVRSSSDLAVGFTAHQNQDATVYYPELSEPCFQVMERSLHKIFSPVEERRFTTSLVKILSVYHRGPWLEGDVEDASRALEEVSRKINQVYDRTHPQVQKELLSVQKRLNEYVQTMNGTFSHLTRRDILNVAFFFKPTERKTFYDAELDISYAEPDHSHLCGDAQDYYYRGEYRKIGLTRKYLGIHPVTGEGHRCDLLYFLKRPDQIAYEQEQKKGTQKFLFFMDLPKDSVVFNNSVSAALHGVKTAVIGDSAKRIEQRIAQQKADAEEGAKYLEEKIAEWGYESFYPCTGQELVARGFPCNNADELTAILFFYKPLEER